MSLVNQLKNIYATITCDKIHVQSLGRTFLNKVIDRRTVPSLNPTCNLLASNTTLQVFETVFIMNTHVKYKDMREKHHQRPR